jgi:hypothetical protein
MITGEVWDDTLDHHHLIQIEQKEEQVMKGPIGLNPGEVEVEIEAGEVRDGI